MTWAVHLTGDHASLAQAELEAVCGPAQWLGPRIALVNASLEDVSRLAFLREAGRFLFSTHDQVDVLDALAPTVAASAQPGSQAVASVRTGQTKSPNSQMIRRAWGTALAAEHPIDLHGADHTVSAWFHDGQVTAVWRATVGATDHSRRGVEHRAHFSPVSLPPRVAAALVHLTGCRPGQTVYDPFCGTGGIALEAAMMGYQVLASDLDPWMVQGTLCTLTDAGPEPLDADVFVADIGDAPDLASGVDGIVTDMPYGSASTTNQEALASLYGRAFEAFRAILPVGGRAVIGHADAELLRPVEEHGFLVEHVHEHFVHKSLTRRYAVVKRDH